MITLVLVFFSPDTWPTCSISKMKKSLSRIPMTKHLQYYVVLKCHDIPRYVGLISIFASECPEDVTDTPLDATGLIVMIYIAHTSPPYHWGNHLFCCNMFDQGRVVCLREYIPENIHCWTDRLGLKLGNYSNRNATWPNLQHYRREVHYNRILHS